MARPIYALSGTEQPGSARMAVWLGVLAVVGLIFWGTVKGPEQRKA